MVVLAASPVPWELSCRPQAPEGRSSGLPQHPEQKPACLMPPSARGFLSPGRTLSPSVGPAPLIPQDPVAGWAPAQEAPRGAASHCTKRLRGRGGEEMLL